MTIRANSLLSVEALHVFGEPKILDSWLQGDTPHVA